MEFADERERELYATAVLGEDVRKFLTGDPVGQYLHHRAKQTLEQARHDSLAVDPDGFGGWFRARRRLRAIRAQAEAARTLIQWFADAITDGDRAAIELKDYRS